MHSQNNIMYLGDYFVNHQKEKIIVINNSQNYINYICKFVKQSHKY
jgi:hypothetical protein